MSAPFTTFPIPTSLDEYVYLSNFGVVGDNFTDDTAALNTAFASLLGSAGTVIWDVGFCKTTGTVVVGSQNGGAGAPTSFINIVCPKGAQGSGIKYHGSGTALLFAKNKFFTVTGLFVNNPTGVKGSTIGMILGGAGAGSFGTQTLAATFTDCLVDSFNVGITDGNFGASSEILWNNLTLYNNDTGWVSNDFNTLDHVFVELAMSGNGIGLDSGAATGPHVFGGSASLSTVADFKCQSNGGIVVRNFRSEEAQLFAIGAGGLLIAKNCLALSPVASIAISGTFSILKLEDNVLHGSVHVGNPSVIFMEGNTLSIWDTTTNLPLFFTPVAFTNQLATYCLLKNNLDAAFPPVPIQDLDGSVGTRYDGAVTTKVFYEPNITVIPINLSVNPTIGINYLALSHVRQLSEGTIPGALAGSTPTPGQNLRVSGTFATSGSLSFTFKRTLTITSTAVPAVTATVGTFLKTDVGKPLKITAGADTGADWYGYITAYNSTTSVDVFTSSQASPGNRYPQSTGKTGTVGADEPDANYIVAGLVGDANETFWVTGLTASGFTLHSSNAGSTATVTALIVR